MCDYCGQNLWALHREDKYFGHILPPSLLILRKEKIHMRIHVCMSVCVCLHMCKHVLCKHVFVCTCVYTSSIDSFGHFTQARRCCD